MYNVRTRLLAVAAAAMLTCVAPVSVAAQQVSYEGSNLVVAKTLGDGRSGEPPVAGAHFVAALIPSVKVTSAQELGEIAKARPELLTDAAPTTTTFDAFTDAAGLARFADLPAGVYQVREIPLRDDNSVDTTAVPFLVYVGDEPVTTRAKQQPAMVEKRATSDTAVPGEELSYEIGATVPETDCYGRLFQLVMDDNLDPRLRYSRIGKAQVSNLETTIDLVEGTDYVVKATEEPGAFVRIELTDAGLDKVAKIRQGNPETRVNFEIVTKVEHSADGSLIVNIASYAPDGYCIPVYPVQAQAAGEAVSYALAAADCIDAPRAVESEPVFVDFIGREEPSKPGSSASTPWWLLPIAFITGWLGGSSVESGSSTGAAPGSSTAPSGEATSGQSAPVTPGSEAGAQTPGKSGIGKRLASTGAAVLGVAALGALFIVIALILLRRKKKEKEEES